ncbi:unnamed protein product [Paramecium pentaurelia]|uniref:Uncharacterized protein n=1 Tax=Paramecium pentaurelia TaxID=43138 RepID=A0A8S1XZG2_9CILI|nr:unnamed protein product [Paramecium pentaurelia]
MEQQQNRMNLFIIFQTQNLSIYSNHGVNKSIYQKQQKKSGVTMTSYYFEMQEFEASYHDVNQAALIFYEDTGGSHQDTDKFLNWEEDLIQISKSSPSQRDYKKNICRNILRQAVKSMRRGKQFEFLQMELQKETSHFIDYYQKNLHSINGFRSLKNQLIIDQKDTSELKLWKRVFQSYMVWFLNKRASLFILNGEANNFKEYLRFKNEVMLFYTQFPEQWCSNEPSWKICN